MVKITVGADCGNAPKKLFLKDLNIAFVEANTGFISEGLDKDIQWEIVGDKTLHGRDEFLRTLQQMIGDKTRELIIKTVVTHGNEAAVSGERTMEDGKKYSFCDVYTFRGAKGDVIKAISSYVIEVR